MIKLEEDDYRYLYPFFYCHEIKKEFGEYAHSVPTINRVYKKVGFKPISAARHSLFCTSFTLDPGEGNPWSQEVMKLIAEYRNVRKNVIWNKIKEREKLNAALFSNLLKV